MSIKEEIINGTYKKKNKTLYDQIIDGSYKSKISQELEKNESESQNINLPNNSAQAKTTAISLPINKTVSNLPIVKDLNNTKIAKENNLPILPVNTQPQKSSRTVTDVAKEFLDTTGKSAKTVLNAGLNLARGVVSVPEDIIDDSLQFASSKYNPVMQATADDLSTKDKVLNIIKTGLIGAKNLTSALNILNPTSIATAKTNSIITKNIENSMKESSSIKSKQNIAQELMQKNVTNDLIDEKLGYNKTLSNGKTVKETIEDGSLIKQDNLGGQIFQSIGQMLPSMMIGQATTGGEALKEAVSLGTMALSSAAGGLETAYSNGANRDEATRYALLNAAVETASEKMFAGIGGVFGKGAIDDVLKKGIQSKIKNKVVQKITEFGLDAVGEGLEELASDIMQPIAQKLTYLKEEDLKKLYAEQNYLEDFVSGVISSTILQGMSLPSTISYENNQNKVNLPTVKYQPETSDNSKINNLRQSAVNYFDNSQKTHDLVSTIEKVIADKDYNVVFDNTITNKKGESVNAQITNNNGQIEIKINPNSERAGEFLLCHEITHAIETNSMKQLVIDYASKHSDFNESLESLKQSYGTNEVTDEVLADISGQLFGNQEFINNLSMKQPNVFKRIYNKIVELANKITGNSKEGLFIKDLKNKWETAYRNTPAEQAISNLNNEKKYAQKTLKDGTNYIETEKNLFTKEDGTTMSQREIYNSLVGKQITFNDGITATVKQWLPNNKNMYNELFKRYPNYKNVDDIKSVNKNINENIVELLENSDNVSPNEPDYMNRHKDNKIDSFDTRKVSFFDGKNAYDLDFSIAKMQDGNYVAYAKRNLSANDTLLNKIKKEAPTSKSRGVLPYVDNISQNNNNVKSDISSTKYSMQENINNTQELDNSSFSLDANAKRYEDLFKTNKIEYFRKDNGDIRIYLIDSNNNLVNQFDLWSNTNAIKELGEKLGNHIYETANNDNQIVNIGNDINNLGTDTDYFMNHRPTESGITADNLINQNVESPMPKDMYEHPEYYFMMNEEYSKESMDALKKIKGNPNAEITIYRATPGNSINSGDWITLSKKYAEFHNQSQFDGKGNIIKKVVRAKDIQYAGDDINEWGYFPTTNDDIRYSKQDNKWQEYVEDNYKTTGTRTKFEDIKIPIAKENKINLPPVQATNEVVENDTKINLPDKEYYKNKLKELKEIDYNSLTKEGKQLYDEQLNRYESFINENTNYNKVNLPPVENKPSTEINSKKYDLNKLTIEQLIKDKNQSLNNLDNKIEQKTNEYNLKKNKDTKIANNLKQQIAILKNRKNNIELDYNKRIEKLNSKNVRMLNDEQSTIENNSNKITRKDVQESLLEEMGITTDDISHGKDINSIDSFRTDPIRLNEKVFGYKVGQKINDATINKTKYNESERTRFLNKERNEIRKLGIKARSKESAAVQKYAEKQYVSEKGDIYKYGDYELAQEFSNEATQKKIKKAAQVLRNKYDIYIDQINEVITNMGYNPIPKRNDYMHHFNEINDKLSNWGIPLNMNSLKEDVLPTDINGITDQFKPGKNWFASAMHRTGPKTTYDAITGIDSYLEGASNLIYHTEDIQRYRTLSKYIRETYGQMHGLDNIDKMNPEQIKQRIEDVNNSKLSKYAAWLDEQANSLAGKKGAIDRSTERALGRRIYSILDTAKKQVGSNMTGFNVRSALTNFASVVQGASKTNKIAFVKGTISTLQNMVHNDGLINKSTFLTNRFGSNSLSTKLWQKVSNAGQILMTGSDYFTANQIWRSKYYENLQKGMNEAEAIKNADDFSSRIMGDRSKGSTAEIFNSKTLGLLTQFQLEVNNYWSSLIHDNKIDVQSGNKSGATVIFQLGQLAAASYMFNNLMKSLTGSGVMLDPIDMLMKIFNSDDDDKSLEERTFEVIGDLVDNIPFGNIFTGGGRIPINEAFTGGNTFLKKVTNQTNTYGNEITWNDVKNDMIGSAFYWILPTGYGQLRKTSKGLSMYDVNLPVAGSYTNSGNLRFTADESTGGKIKAALFGQYSSEEAQKYIESGYKTISKNRIKDMKELNMTSSEYRDYRTALNNASSTTDKNGYTKYEDNNNNIYWYDKTNKIVYDNNYNIVNKSITSLNKVNSKEKVFEYINSLDISDKEKSKLINAEYGGEKTDQYGNIKYISNDYVYSTNGLQKYKNSSGTTYWVNPKTGYIYNNNGNISTNIRANNLTPVKEEKTYWYNETNNILYDSNYNKVDVKKLDSLTKVETKIDMSEYDKYNSYEEYNYATSNPTKYALISQITTYDKYNTYKEKINSIKEQSSNKKNDIIKYVNSLNLNIPQKAMLIKTQYSSYDKYDKQIIQYINSKKISIDEKTKILQELGFTVRNGKVIS